MRKDKFTVQERSRIMRKIRPSKTKFEEEVFSLVRKQGIRYFKTNYTRAYGKPDIALPKARKAVFLHSDFWHGWRLPAWEAILPSEFWKNKLKRNRARDQKVLRTLRRQGWKVLVVWEHSLKKNPKQTINSIVEFLRQ